MSRCTLAFPYHAHRTTALDRQLRAGFVNIHAEQWPSITLQPLIATVPLMLHLNSSTHVFILAT